MAPDSKLNTVLIDINGDYNLELVNVIQTKVDLLLEKLRKVNLRVGETKVIQSHQFILDGLDLDNATDMIREHLGWINDNKTESFDKRIKDINEMLKNTQKKIQQILVEDFDQMTPSNITKVITLSKNHKFSI